MASVTTDPLRMYEGPKGVMTVTTARGTFGVANNQAVVAAITGQRIRVMGWIAQGSGAAVGTFQLKTSTGPVTIMAPLMVPTNAAGACDRQPIVDCGYMETATGDSLTVDVTVAGVNLTIFYITYAP